MIGKSSIVILVAVLKRGNQKNEPLLTKSKNIIGFLKRRTLARVVFHKIMSDEANLDNQDEIEQPKGF